LRVDQQRKATANKALFGAAKETLKSEVDELDMLLERQ
jgi:hypothetical protein